MGSVAPTTTGRVRFSIACPGASKDRTFQNDIGVQIFWQSVAYSLSAGFHISAVTHILPPPLILHRQCHQYCLTIQLLWYDFAQFKLTIPSRWAANFKVLPKPSPCQIGVMCWNDSAPLREKLKSDHPPYFPGRYSLSASQSPLQHMLQVPHHQLQPKFLFYAYNKCSPKRQSELKSVDDTGGLQGFEISPPDIFPCWLQEIVDSLLLLMELLDHFSLSPDFPINFTPYSSQTLLLLIMFIAISKTTVCKIKIPVSQPSYSQPPCNTQGSEIVIGLQTPLRNRSCISVFKQHWHQAGWHKSKSCLYIWYFQVSSLAHYRLYCWKEGDLQAVCIPEMLLLPPN